MTIEQKMNTLRKRIEKRKKTIKEEQEKLKQDEAEYNNLKSTALTEFMDKEKIEFNADFKQSMALAKKILASGVSDADIADFFSLTDDSTSPNKAISSTTEVKKDDEK
ncbi:MAG: hypothetical protein Q4D37_09235 [Oscillospiraceae bacterium]|nr:hypothetical protein [Oscillospiraceae bacterium]